MGGPPRARSRHRAWPRMGLAAPLFALGLAIAAGLVLWAARIVRDVVTQARNPLPLFRLDRVGLESALGQLQWRDVQLVRVNRHENDHGERWTVSFVTDAGAALAKPGDVYYGGRRFRSPRRTATGIDVPLWESRPVALRDVRHFYDGRVSDEYETPITSFPVEARYRPCPECGHRFLRDRRKCRACGQRSEPWSYRDGRWWYTSATGRRQWLDEDANAWRWEDDGTPSPPSRPLREPRLPLQLDEEESTPRPRRSALLSPSHRRRRRAGALRQGAHLATRASLPALPALAIRPGAASPPCRRQEGFRPDLRCAVRGNAALADASPAPMGLLSDVPRDAASPSRTTAG